MTALKGRNHPIAADRAEGNAIHLRQTISRGSIAEDFGIDAIGRAVAAAHSKEVVDGHHLPCARVPIVALPRCGSSTLITLSRPVLQRLLDGRTKGIVLIPLGSITADFLPASDAANAPMLCFNLAP